MSLSYELMGTRAHEIAVELAQQFTDDFQKQEEFIEGFLEACVWHAQRSSEEMRESN